MAPQECLMCRDFALTPEARLPPSGPLTPSLEPSYWALLTPQHVGCGAWGQTGSMVTLERGPQRISKG